jgi:bacillithiol synthase
LQTECYPISILPNLSRIFRDYCERPETLSPFFAATPRSNSWIQTPSSLDPTQRAQLADLLDEQNTLPAARANIDLIRQGANVVVSGQQVGLLGGPLYTLLKAATAVRKAQDATRAGHPHVPVFWLATEDHDFEEVNHVSLPGRRAIETLVYKGAHRAGVPVGSVAFGPEIDAVLRQAEELIGAGESFDQLRECYREGRTFAQAFSQWIANTFASQGLIVLDASSRGFHTLGSNVLRQAIENAGKLHQLLNERDTILAASGYHSQVLVGPQSSLLFLVDSASGVRQVLKYTGDQSWQAGRQTYSSSDLLAILEAQPERLSPNALLRPVFQDAILPTSAYIGGPAEIAYFAQSQVLYQEILGRTTTILPRLTATLVEPQVAELMQRHEITLSGVLPSTPDEIAQRLGARSIPVEGKRKLAASGNALDTELTQLTQYMESLDAGLGRSGMVAASKMRYQMNRLRRLTANFQLQKEASLARHAEALSLALFPQRHPQERLVGAAYFLGRYGSALTDRLIQEAGQECPGHKALFL